MLKPSPKQFVNRLEKEIINDVESSIEKGIRESKRVASRDTGRLIRNIDFKKVSRFHWIFRSRVKYSSYHNKYSEYFDKGFNTIISNLRRLLK